MELKRPFDSVWPVSPGDPGPWATAINAMLAPRFASGWNGAFMEEAFHAVGRAYGGRQDGLLACDTPYHDLRHALESALATARLIDGWELERGAHGESLGAPLAMTGVLLGLLHDVGFLRRRDEAGVAGATLAPVHEARSAEFAQRFLGASPLAALSHLGTLIEATRLGTHIGTLATDTRHVALGCMLATADLVSQLADRFYLERCRDFLYAEFVDAGLARGPGGRNPSAPYATPEDLLHKTPAFYRRHVLARLDGELGAVHRLFATHFGGVDPYRVATALNLNYLERVLASGRFDMLRRKPQAMVGPR